MTKKITHMTDDFMIDIEGRNQEEVLKAINDAGYTIGHNSLKMLLNGTCFQAGMFEVIDVRFEKKKPEHQQLPVVLVSDVIVPRETKVVTETPVVIQKQSEIQPAPQETPQKAIKQVAKAPKQKSVKVVSDGGNNGPESVLTGTKNAKMFEMLARPEGATREEIMKEFDWSPSCLASIIYTVPKSKGYAIFAEKAEDDHQLHYHLYFIGGAGKVLPEQVLYRTRVGQSVKKDKVLAPATESHQHKVSISKETLDTVPTNNIASMAASLSQHFQSR